MPGFAERKLEEPDRVRSESSSVRNRGILALSELLQARVRRAPCPLMIHSHRHSLVRFKHPLQSLFSLYLTPGSPVTKRIYLSQLFSQNVIGTQGVLNFCAGLWLTLVGMDEATDGRSGRQTSTFQAGCLERLLTPLLFGHSFSYNREELNECGFSTSAPETSLLIPRNLQQLEEGINTILWADRERLPQ